MRCKSCGKTFKSCGCTGKHCWERSQNCFKCHYLGINQNASKSIRIPKEDHEKWIQSKVGEFGTKT